METLKLLIFVGTEGIYHDHAGTGSSSHQCLTALTPLKPISHKTTTCS